MSNETTSEPDLFRSLLDAAPDATVVVDASGKIVYANLRVTDVFGYRREELIGEAIELLIPERFRKAHGHHRQQYSGAPRFRPMGSGLDLYGRKQDGSEFPLEISLSPLSTSQGVLVSASIRDISKRRESEQKLQRIQAHLLSAVESIQGAFAIFDAQQRAVLCNSTFQILLGRHLETPLVGSEFETILDRNISAGVFDVGATSPEKLRADWLAHHQLQQGAFDVRTQDGRILRVVERPTAEGGTVALITDVSDDVAREDELRLARALAEAASSAKSEFLASMSHELRTPLNAVLGFAQLLQRDKKSPLSARQQERVGHVLKGGAHLLRLIDEVLDLARIEAGGVSVSLEPVSVGEVISEVVSTLDTLAAPAEIRLLQPSAAALAQVIADRTRLRQILMNYGSNAIKYGRKHGKVAFEVSMREAGVRITICDDGIGIPSAKQDKIFQPFQRAGQEAGTIEGTGIGLTITKRLAELMHGEVGFESEEGKGSSFWIELPAPAADVQGTPTPRPVDRDALTIAAASGPRYTVVYVEDNPSNIAFIEDMLADFERVQLLTAPTAEIGVALIRARQPKVVIMDINLPGMSGLEAMKQLKHSPETQDIPVVALSAAAMVQDAKRVLSAGFYKYLTKPVKVDELMHVLEELLVQPGSSEPLPSSRAI